MKLVYLKCREILTPDEWVCVSVSEAGAENIFFNPGILKNPAVVTKEALFQRNFFLDRISQKDTGDHISDANMYFRVTTQHMRSKISDLFSVFQNSQDATTRTFSKSEFNFFFGIVLTLLLEIYQTLENIPMLKGDEMFNISRMVYNHCVLDESLYPRYSFSTFEKKKNTTTIDDGTEKEHHLEIFSKSRESVLNHCLYIFFCPISPYYIHRNSSDSMFSFIPPLKDISAIKIITNNEDNNSIIIPLYDLPYHIFLFSDIHYCENPSPK
jgi:hypothetical protein